MMFFQKILGRYFKFFGNEKSDVDKNIHYVRPTLECSNSLLLSGPSYGDKTFFGSFILDLNDAYSWIKDHSKSVYSTNKLEQEARLFLPIWVKNLSSNADGYVTLLDNPMRQVLVPYTYDFYLKGWLKVYCYECSMLHDTLIDKSTDSEKDGNVRRWVEEWQCSKGHIVHRKDEELRLLVR